jgi:hypothetical protein
MKRPSRLDSRLAISNSRNDVEFGSEQSGDPLTRLVVIIRHQGSAGWPSRENLTSCLTGHLFETWV